MAVLGSGIRGRCRGLDGGGGGDSVWRGGLSCGVPWCGKVEEGGDRYICELRIILNSPLLFDIMIKRAPTPEELKLGTAAGNGRE